ncbi:hypothetical protein AMOR_37860 [Anaeromyxobacter oryzae]|uniref:Uncharacterized protein n=2 Tax=Anaeromyxobacter oryzae TaxID=2918170 RepID=A0ABM7WZ69_9BACT|nr:hypothetical protein AMOR_37860 [Anaeromyxobacter oryzae]
MLGTATAALDPGLVSALAACGILVVGLFAPFLARRAVSRAIERRFPVPPDARAPGHRERLETRVLHAYVMFLAFAWTLGMVFAVRWIVFAVYRLMALRPFPQPTSIADLAKGALGLAVMTGYGRLLFRQLGASRRRRAARPPSATLRFGA